MTTQVRPLAGGAWNTISQTPMKMTKKDTVFGVALSNALAAAGYRALNEWVNCAGVGTAATRAQAVAFAAGLQIQEV